MVAERASGPVAPDDARERRFREALAAAGGGILESAVQRDVTGAARRLLGRAAWLPDLASCLAIQALLPAGWIVVTRDGSAIVGQLGVTFGAAESILDRRAEATRLAGELETHEAEAAKERGIAVRLAAAAKEAADAVETARADESRAAGARRAAEEAERLVARQHETAIREHAWHDAQTERLRADLERARIAAAAPQKPTADENADTGTPVDGAALAAWETRAAELRARRDRLAEEFAGLDSARRDAENRRARAEASTVIAEERMARADREVLALGERERAAAAERDALRAEIATTAAAEAGARQALSEVQTADAADRERLTAAERETASARERLRSADAALRTADHAELEARLGLDALHEGIVVELAGLGEFGIAGLEAAAGVRPGSARIAGALDTRPVEARADGRVASEDEETVSDDAAELEAALALVTPIWAAAATGLAAHRARPGSASSVDGSTISAP